MIVESSLLNIYLGMATSTITQSLKRLLPLKKSELPPALKPRTGNLYQVLSRTPTGGVGSEVHQLRWSEKQIANSYWVITRSKFKCGGNHGKAWGRLYWKGWLGFITWLFDTISYIYTLGVPVSPREELIRGALKYTWKEGRSKEKWIPSQISPETVQNVRVYSSCSQIS